jgi:phage replication O-like protein O
MSSPQLEKGYTKIANEIMEALCGIRISGEARQCLDVIFRKTYGFNKKYDKISLSQFCLLTKMRKGDVCRALLKLNKLNIIISKKANDNITSYRFNKDFDTWKPLAKKLIVSKKANASLAKKRHTKETNTKEILSSNDDKKLNQDVKSIIDYWFVKWQGVYGTKPIVSGGKFTKVAKPVIKAVGLEKSKKVCDSYFLTDNEMYRKQSWGFMTMMSSEVFNSLLTKI